jgi:hypothetical protein
MYAIVKKVVMPPMTSPEMLGWWIVVGVGGGSLFGVRDDCAALGYSRLSTLKSQLPIPNVHCEP